MNIIGKLIKKLERETGVSKAGKTWEKQSILVEQSGTDYNKEVVISFFGDKMKSMLDLEIEGKFIKLFPGDSVPKYGLIRDATKEGIVVTITSLGPTRGYSTHYDVGQRHFIPWGKLQFQFVCSMEANTGGRQKS